MLDWVMSKKWKVLHTEELFTTSIMKLRVEKCELPDGRVMPRYYVIDFPDWVHVVALTADAQVVLVKQYRQAARETFWEVPGGTLDPRKVESPFEAAQRELQEETGYTSKEWTCIGIHSPNPATQTNKIHTYLALNCEKTHDLNLDPYEDLDVELKSVTEVKAMLRGGKFTHSLVMSSLVLAEEYF
jgi:8-oxo-dGTP pyrophosphatase MutT (NUDIX family)